MADLYYKIPTEAELADEPYSVQDFIDARDDVDVWEECWDVLTLFRMNCTQWRVSMAGPYALDLTVFHHEMDRKKVEEEKYDEMLWMLGVIEAAALKHLHKKP